MNRHRCKLLSEASPQSSLLREQIIAYWQELGMSGDSGATSWEVLDRLRDRVTESLLWNDLASAGSLTAKAMLLVAGTVEC